MSAVVPFGKYKGREVEEMVADKQYCDWLQAQPWFGERFPQMRVLIMQTGNEPQDTPEHNEQQARFLDPEYCLRLWRALDPSAAVEQVLATAHAKFVAQADHEARAVQELGKRIEGARADLAEAESREADGKKHAFGGRDAAYWVRRCKEVQDQLDEARADAAKAADLLADVPAWMKQWPGPTARQLRFEVEGWDVVFDVEFGPHDQPLEDRIRGYSTSLLVECKPVIGDDYPAVLRQVLKRRPAGYSGHRIVFADTVRTSNVSFEQVTAIFATQGIRLIDNSRIDQ